MADQCQNNKEEESEKARKRESGEEKELFGEQNDQTSKLDNIIEATEALRQANARIARARELLKEIPESFYHHETLSKAAWDIEENLKKLTLLTNLIHEHNDVKGIK